MARVLITGAAGFVGKYLANSLVATGHNVFGTDQMILRAPSIFKDFYQASLLDASALRNIIAETRPDVIFHLAGILKAEQPETFYTVNVLGTVTLFEVIRTMGVKPKVVVTSSSAVYGLGLGTRPISEGFRTRPITHYAASKVAQEIVALRYYEAENLPVTIVRTFNLLGPGLSPDLASSSFARQIALAEAGRGSRTIITGDLSARRDFVDVRDAVRAYVLVAFHGLAGSIYNVCSGEPVSMQDCIKKLLKLSRVPMDTARDPARVQENDVPVQVGSAARLRRLTGWKPEIGLTQSLADLLDDWRKKIKTDSE
ncbi:MAG: GDP-mannose 4,6-dehydratase [Anaerolineales bacterium]|nr:GDP-mannose 4,6-dehydratase [Anaerolineales bacterium]